MPPARKTNSPPVWAHPPSVCQALAPIEAITGQQNLNPVWSGDVIQIEGATVSDTYRSVFKLLNPDTTLPVELACSLAGQLLGNDVPPPCLVLAEPADLPGVPDHFRSRPIPLFGCTYVAQDGFFEQLSSLESDHTLQAAVWNHYCKEAERAASGAALDELIANFDRHFRNLRFDGRCWWLIDHDKSLMTTHRQDLAAMPAQFRAHTNHIAGELLTRRRQDHDMAEAARLKAAKHRELLSLAALAGQWRHDDALIQGVFTRTAQLLSLLARRLPMLESMIGERIGATQPPTLSWTPPSSP